jgi:hypothetical protein
MAGALVAITAGGVSLWRLQELWIEYRATAEALKREKMLFLTQAPPYDTPQAFGEFVTRVEALLGSENATWAERMRAQPPASAPKAEDPEGCRRRRPGLPALPSAGWIICHIDRPTPGSDNRRGFYRCRGQRTARWRLPGLSFTGGNMTRLTPLLLCCVLLGACGSMPGAITGDAALAVNAPIYRANKIFYVEKMRADEGQPRRFSDLKEPQEYTDVADAVQNGDPVTIVVNRAYVPTTLTDAKRNRRLSTLIGRSDTRDIAVLLDFGGQAEQAEEFIAVWYERDVAPDQTLSFQDLVVYSQDSWDNRVPPYFRLRIVDVTNERNTRTGELLNQVRLASGSLASFVTSPVPGAAINIATRAAELVLTNEENRALVDYTFNLFSVAQIGEAGGMPLGQFKAGGIILMGQPFDEPNTFWEAAFQYDFRLRRVQLTGKPQETVAAPYLIATIMTADAVVPNVVKRRSQYIARVLTDRSAVRENLAEVIQDAGNLQRSLQTMSLREEFSRFPTKESFQVLIDSLSTNWDSLPDPERKWLLSVIRHTTGVGLASIGEYVDWYERCRDAIDFDDQARKFDVKGKADASGKNCESGA